MFKKILIAYDGSPTSTRALEHAHDLASKYGGELVLVHAYPILPVEFLSPTVEQVQADVMAASDKLLQDTQAAWQGKGVPIKTDLLQGPPADAILDAAKRHQCDLIVVGSRGLGELSSMFLGSVSNKILHHATIPVLVVK